MTRDTSMPSKTQEPPWSFHSTAGSAISFHNKAMPGLTNSTGQAWIHRTTPRALVFGSAQSEDLIDRVAAEDAGWEVGHRRSGGGIVVIVPGTHLWVDFLIGREHPLWDDDVHRAFDWVGTLWARTLHRLTGIEPHVHHGPLTDRDAGRLLCFAGLGTGEISINGYKLVGLSQRRTRAGARFQTMLELDDHSGLLRPFARGRLSELLDQRAADRPERGIGLPPQNHGLTPLLELDQTLETLLDTLLHLSPTGSPD